MASPTNDFLKSRASASAAVKLGQWHAGFSAVKKYAVDKKVPRWAGWSSGDACGRCRHFELVCMDRRVVSWMKTFGVAFWFGCSKDKTADDKFEGTGFKFARNNKLTDYPFVRLYWPSGKVDTWKSGDGWTGGIREGNLSKCVDKFLKNLKAALKGYKPGEGTPAPAPAPAPEKYKVRFNEKKTTAQVNKVLDGIDANGGYCPCQAKAANTKCQCEDFTKNKGIGEPCICGIYVKQKA